MAYSQIRPSLRNASEGLMPYTIARSSPGECLLLAQPQLAFQPQGLLLFDLPERATIGINRIGVQEQLTVCFGPLPARWFAQAQSFEQIAKLLDEGKQPAAWGDWDMVQVGQTLQLQLNWPEKKEASPLAVMWGHTLRH